MKIAVDTSAWVKRYIFEPGSEKIGPLLMQATELGVSVILLPEVISAFNRILREGRISVNTYQTLKHLLMTDIESAQILLITPEVIRIAINLLEKHPLRAMDAIHIACALAWGADRFVTADRRQMHAAINAGLPTQFIESS